jgi:hypothetical protein
MMKLRLSGWQRLGIALSVSFFVIVFAYVAYEVGTTPSSIEQTPSVFDEFSLEDHYFVMFAPDKTLRMAELTKPATEIRRAIPYARELGVRSCNITFQ